MSAIHFCRNIALVPRGHETAKSAEDLLKLPWDLQVPLASGYAAYVLGYIVSIHDVPGLAACLILKSARRHKEEGCLCQDRRPKKLLLRSEVRPGNP